jgi:hypothetical protein
MAKAGFCSGCQSNVWLTASGTCSAGHGADCISNVYEAAAPAVAAQGTNRPVVRVKKYKGERAFQKDAEKMYGDGWHIEG